MNMRPQFYSPEPLDDEQLYQRAPSVFTYSAHRSRSERFRAIPTIHAVRALRNEGWECYGAGQGRTRTPDRARYTKHMLKFRHRDTSRLTKVGDSVLETILTNANDGTKGFRLDCGIFRLACLNGMVVKSHDFGALMIRHSGDDVLDRVLAGTYEIARHADKVMEAPARWSKIRLDDVQARLLAHAANKLRFGDDDRIEDHQLLIPRRPADNGRDLWTIFNIVQENVIAGGLVEAIASRRNRRFASRAVTGIDANLRLNRELWAMAEGFAERLA
jgi:hypothetical protein